MIMCEHCGKRTKITNTAAIKDYWYVPPRGCTEGDYWDFNEYQHHCPKCDRISSAYVGSFDRKEWDKGNGLDNIQDSSLKKLRVQNYFLIKDTYELFGEQLTNYDYGSTIEDIRQKHKAAEERRNDRGW